jgi:beta-glucosidase
LLSYWFALALEAQSGAPASAPDVRTGIYDPSLDARVETLLRRMTLEEKVGQVVQYSAGQPTGPGTNRTDYEDMIAKGQIGALFNISTAKGNQSVPADRSRKIAPEDSDHFRTGCHSRFPHGISGSARSGIDLGSGPGGADGQGGGARSLGNRDSLDVFPPWSTLPAMLAGAASRKVPAKTHFSAQRWQRLTFVAIKERAWMNRTALPPAPSISSDTERPRAVAITTPLKSPNTPCVRSIFHRFAQPVNAGAATIMSAFNSLNGVPASANPFTLRQVLREEWGFRGVVDSDWESVREVIQHGIANDRATAARKAFLAGVDMDMASSVYHDHLGQLVSSGQVPQERLDESVRNVLRLKFALGLFEHPYADEAREAQAMLRPDGVSLARTAAERSFVLLKNSPGPNNAPLLPLSNSGQRIALIGPLADDLPSALGSWAGLGRGEDVVSFQAALAKHVGEQNLIHLKGVGATGGGSDEDLAAAVAASGRADVVILALGEPGGEMTGEATSRAFSDCPGVNRSCSRKSSPQENRWFSVLFSGRPLTLPWAFEHVPAVLAAWLPGIQAGPALVRTLYGESSPTGKLVVSWPAAWGRNPFTTTRSIRVARRTRVT